MWHYSHELNVVLEEIDRHILFGEEYVRLGHPHTGQTYWMQLGLLQPVDSLEPLSADEEYNRAQQEKQTAVGFLMVLMQRLVTSSTRAIRTSLQRRLQVLDDERWRLHEVSFAASPSLRRLYNILCKVQR